jgi:hypothetical protein
MGCGYNKIDGFINVDKFDTATPEVVADLEVFPWPFETNSVSEVMFNHALEHMGETTDVFLGIIKELYRVCKPNAVVHINVPHPRHDNFINDPTHVRIITPDVLSLFSKKLNHQWIKAQAANSPLGLYLNVDFELSSVKFTLVEKFLKMLESGDLTVPQINEMVQFQNNIVSEIRMIALVKKEEDNDYNEEK